MVHEAEGELFFPLCCYTSFYVVVLRIINTDLIQIANKAELEKLLDEAAYKAHCDADAH